MFQEDFANKMAELQVYFISALVLSCCLQILAGCASCLVARCLFNQEGLLYHLGRPSSRERELVLVLELQGEF